MSTNLALGFIIAGIVLVVVAVLEHVLFTSTVLVPHLGIILGVQGLIAGAIGGVGLVIGKGRA